MFFLKNKLKIYLCLPLFLLSLLWLADTGWGFGQRGQPKAKEIPPGFEFKFQPAPANLTGFPDCSFTRPFGYKMENYGRTAAPENIDNNPEGSACPVGGFGAGGYEWTISGNFRYWFLKPGWYVDEIIPADAFHVFLKKGQQKIVQTISADRPKDVLRSWKWGLASGSGDYFA
ncbi:MAG: GH116 family glycosyl-hydrolase, partial [Candidatus Saccharicenans sp.]